jgi:polyphosphate kinase
MNSTLQETPRQPLFFDRDISWLSFNERVLMEAENENIPLLERLKFLAIYSSNLDEFYSVRVPSIIAVNKLKNEKSDPLFQINETVVRHQHRYGTTLKQAIIPALREDGIHFLYDEGIPETIESEVRKIFFTKVAGFLRLFRCSKDSTFFPKNDKIFLAVVLKDNNDEEMAIVNIPSNSLSRFHTVSDSGKRHVIFIDDIVRQHLPDLFVPATIAGVYSFKVTRNAELNIADEFAGNLTKKLERLIAKRDYGFATRILYDETMPEEHLMKLNNVLGLSNVSRVAGGRYHNLKDLFSFPLRDPMLSNVNHRPISIRVSESGSVFDLINQKDIMLHTPFHSYDLVIRFFNESAIDPLVERIYVTLYRIASNSAIAQALMTAAYNGKKVTVLVELTARFDEANNIRWAKKMKAAGVRIIYNKGLKLHAKIALVKRRSETKNSYYGLLATGNFNETTAQLYTDHILLTAHRQMLLEVLSLVKTLKKRKTQLTLKKVAFDHIIVAPVNLKEKFIALIDREITNAKKGEKASVMIKLNNLEEETIINKLYEASRAGVRVDLLIRSICRVVPGVKGRSENIHVRRIVDRYLEHGRVFIFHNGGKEEVYCGSADWMNRNVYHRIEVCFPVYDEHIANELMAIMKLQFADNVKAVTIDDQLNNRPLSSKKEKIQSQDAIYSMILDSKTAQS